MATPTPTTAAALGPRRVLVCCGSESGTTRRLITRTIKAWTARGKESFVCDLMTGNEAVEKWGSLEAIAKQYHEGRAEAKAKGGKSPTSPSGKKGGFSLFGRSK